VRLRPDGPAAKAEGRSEENQEEPARPGSSGAGDQLGVTKPSRWAR